MPPVSVLTWSAFAALASFGPAAHAQWQVIQLHSAGTGTSRALATSGGAQGGFSQLGSGGYGKPFLWYGSPSNFSDLTPAGYLGGQVTGMSAGQQVGHLYPVGDPQSHRAALWSGTAQSFVSLHPAGYWTSQARAAAGGMQVGTGFDLATNQTHAMLWRGSASSAVDLHPAGTTASLALATDGVYQGGYAIRPVGPPLGTVIHAALWQGTASSYINMNPPGGRESWITSMAPGVQAGWAIREGVPGKHAMLWNGTPQSFLDINPPDALESQIFGTTGTRHVGWVAAQTWGGAAIWMDSTPQSAVNLAALLPGFYSGSEATGVYEENGQIFVSGWAYPAGGGNAQAFLWIHVPGPAGAAVLLAAGLIAAARRRRT